jgi:hypothetical protein
MQMYNYHDPGTIQSRRAVEDVPVWIESRLWTFMDLAKADKAIKGFLISRR